MANMLPGLKVIAAGATEQLLVQLGVLERWERNKAYENC